MSSTSTKEQPPDHPTGKQATALQELIDALNKEVLNLDSHRNDYHIGLVNAYEDAIKKATSLLAKEREQHINTFNAGYSNGKIDTLVTAQFYFYHKYNSTP